MTTPSAGRRRALQLLAGCGIAGVALHAAAEQGYPSRPVRIISAFPPGGPSDSIARVLSTRIQAALGQPLVVEYKAGAGGNIGADFVAKSAPDGYALLMTIDTPLTVNPALYPAMPFKPADLKPISIIASSTLLFDVHPKLGVSSVGDFLALAKTREFDFSSAGNGSPGHLAASMLMEKTGARIHHIMYKGNTPAVLAIVAGEVDAAILATPGLLPQVQAGKLKALAVTGSKRSALAPDIPTMAEAGVSGVEFEVLYLLMAPAATPAEVVSLWQKEIDAALADAEIRRMLGTLDLAIVDEKGAAADARLARNRERYAATIKATGIRFE